MAVDAVLVLRVSPTHNCSKVITSTVENQSVDHSHTRSHGLRNSIYGGACRLEIISAPNDDVLEGDFEFSSGKDFR